MLYNASAHTSSLNTPRFSEEQDRASSSTAMSVKIGAFAGTGKTHTLIGFAEKRPRKNILFLAFNKPVAMEARTRFPANVICKTTHGLAYDTIGLAYAEAGKLGESRIDEIAKFLKCSTIEALCTKKAVDAFLASDSDGLSVEHLDKFLAERAGARTRVDGEWFVEKAWKLWDAMCDPTNPGILLPHDGYLKLFTLSDPDLAREYDGIVMDEGQDSSGAVAKFFMKQTCQKVLVGDPHQSINSWRGAVNAMDRYACDEEFSLTTSYRFGSEVADVANRLFALKGESRRIHGAGVNGGRIGTPAVLCRTNASVLSSAMTLAEHGKAVFFIGGVKSYRFRKIIDACHLMFGNRTSISDPFYASFESFDSLNVYAKDSQDVENVQICKLVKKYGADTLKMTQSAADNAVSHADQANVILGTVHKTKGMEFGTVALEEDFIDLNSISNTFHKNIEEEINLIYVGCTRAQSKLYPSRQLTKWLNKSSPSSH